MRLDVFDKGQNTLIERLIKDFNPIVATFPEVPDEIVAWTCREFERPVTHFVYVKHAYRRLGIGSALIVGSQQHSHQTRPGELFFKRSGSLYNPFLLQE